MPQNSNWEAYRLEFYYFNSMTSRWQAFQEAPEEIISNYSQSSDASLEDNLATVYRRQIQLMLNSVRDALGRAFRVASQPGVFDISRQSRSVVFVPGDIIASLSRVRQYLKLTYKPHVREFVHEVRKRYREEGLNIPVKVEELLRAIETEQNSGTINVREEDALDLLIRLPYLRRWEMAGAMDPFEKSKNRSLTDLLLRRLFAFRILEVDPPVNRNQTSVEKALDYTASLSIAVNPTKKTNKPNGTLADNGLASEGFFDICVAPDDDKELIWYVLYAQIMDQIQFEIAGQRQSYALVFPIRVCGWDHYLHVYFRPSDASIPPDRLLDCWHKHIKELSDDICIQVFKESLREFIVQARIAAFQGCVSKELGEISNLSDVNQTIRTLFLKHAHILVRISWMSFGTQYFHYPDDVFEGWRSGPMPLELPTDCVATIDSPAGQVSACIQWEDVWTKKYNGVLDPFFRDTSRQRLDEQLAWLIRRVRSRELLFLLHNKSAGIYKTLERMGIDAGPTSELRRAVNQLAPEFAEVTDLLDKLYYDD